MENAKLQYRIIHLVRAAKETDLKLEQMEQVSFSDFSTSFHMINGINTKSYTLSIGVSKLLETDKSIFGWYPPKN